MQRHGNIGRSSARESEFSSCLTELSSKPGKDCRIFRDFLSGFSVTRVPQDHLLSQRTDRAKSLRRFRFRMEASRTVPLILGIKAMVESALASIGANEYFKVKHSDASRRCMEQHASHATADSPGLEGWPLYCCRFGSEFSQFRLQRLKSQKSCLFPDRAFGSPTRRALRTIVPSQRLV